MTTSSMHTKVLKIHYPTAKTETIGEISASVRDQVLKLFKGNQMSFSFSVNKSSGYIMVYPTVPILSIRISTHESDGSVPCDNVLIESLDKRTIIINAEAVGGSRVSDAIVADILNEAKATSNTIKNTVKEYETNL